MAEIPRIAKIAHAQRREIADATLRRTALYAPVVGGRCGVGLFTGRMGCPLPATHVVAPDCACGWAIGTCRQHLFTVVDYLAARTDEHPGADTLKVRPLPNRAL